MGNVFKRVYACLLCLMLVSGMVAAVPAGVAVASDDVGSSAVFKEIYTANYDAIVGDYNAGYKYVLFGVEGFGYSTKFAIILSNTPIYVTKPSDYYYMCGSSGSSIVGDSNYHSYLPDGLSFHSAALGSFCASNYDVQRYDNGTVVHNARNLPDWFSVAYVDAADCPAAIPVCSLLPSFYKEEGYLAYYYYKDYPEYAFCVASDSELYVIREKSGTGESRRFVGRVSDGAIVGGRGTLDVMYVYNRKLSTWSSLSNSGHFRPWDGCSLMTLSHAYDSLNDGNNFTLLGTNRAIRQLDFDSSGTLVSETDFSSGGAIGGLPSFPKAPAPELVGTVRAITWSRMMTEVVGLVPLLVGLVISFLALRKGLAVLYRRLRKG